MPQSSATLTAVVKKVKELWATSDETTQAYLLRELEALIERYRQELHGA